MSNTPFDPSKFTAPKAKPLPVILLLDVSGSMSGDKIRNLNDALGSTSILVSHDVKECFAIADYVYFLSSGKIVAHGTPAQMAVSTHPYVKQFVNAEADGPVPFHYPGKSLADDLGLHAGAGR